MATQVPRWISGSLPKNRLDHFVPAHVVGGFKLFDRLQSGKSAVLATINALEVSELLIRGPPRLEELQSTFLDRQAARRVSSVSTPDHIDEKTASDSAGNQMQLLPVSWKFEREKQTLAQRLLRQPHEPYYQRNALRAPKEEMCQSILSWTVTSACAEACWGKERGSYL